MANFTPIGRALASLLIDQINCSTQYVKMHVVQWRNFGFSLLAIQFGSLIFILDVHVSRAMCHSGYPDGWMLVPFMVEGM